MKTETVSGGVIGGGLFAGGTALLMKGNKERASLVLGAGLVAGSIGAAATGAIIDSSRNHEGSLVGAAIGGGAGAGVMLMIPRGPSVEYSLMARVGAVIAGAATLGVGGYFFGGQV